MSRIVRFIRPGWLAGIEVSRRWHGKDRQVQASDRSVCQEIVSCIQCAPQTLAGQRLSPRGTAFAAFVMNAYLLPVYPASLKFSAFCFCKNLRHEGNRRCRCGATVRLQVIEEPYVVDLEKVHFQPASATPLQKASLGLRHVLFEFLRIQTKKSNISLSFLRMMRILCPAPQSMALILSPNSPSR